MYETGRSRDTAPGERCEHRRRQPCGWRPEFTNIASLCIEPTATADNPTPSGPFVTGDDGVHGARQEKVITSQNSQQDSARRKRPDIERLVDAAFPVHDFAALGGRVLRRSIRAAAVHYDMFDL